jgi:hypothetical protein
MTRKIFGCKKGEVTGGWKKLYDMEHHDFYFSSNIMLINQGKCEEQAV